MSCLYCGRELKEGQENYCSGWCAVNDLPFRSGVVTKEEEVRVNQFLSLLKTDKNLKGFVFKGGNKR